MLRMSQKTCFCDRFRGPRGTGYLVHWFPGPEEAAAACCGQCPAGVGLCQAGFLLTKPDSAHPTPGLSPGLCSLGGSWARRPCPHDPQTQCRVRLQAQALWQL